MTALTLWQTRWGYFLGMVFALNAPILFGAFRRWWVGGLAFAISLWPILKEWDLRLYPDSGQRNASHLEATLLREVADNLKGPETAPFLAPWWISPPLAYWSGQPGIAGSSHEAISGTVDMARFYLATDPKQAAQILERRKVARVIADDPARVIDKSAPILGIDEPATCMATLLVDQPKKPAAYLLPVFSNDFFKIYAVDQSRLTQ